MASPHRLGGKAFDVLLAWFSDGGINLFGGDSGNCQSVGHDALWGNFENVPYGLNDVQKNFWVSKEK
ncbi:MAG: hypothetical protein NPIRA06_09540 [Nitrospirales bacterium]|nr:MAG: hypothetical protein NPIRA06_09540 [Nitrospirales bacterium]